MRTANEIADKNGCNECGSDRGDVLAAMREYAIEVVSHIENNIWNYTDEEGCNMGSSVIVADTNEFQELKKLINK